MKAGHLTANKRIPITELINYDEKHREILGSHINLQKHKPDEVPNIEA